jgi:hypothetical protein
MIDLKDIRTQVPPFLKASLVAAVIAMTAGVARADAVYFRSDWCPSATEQQQLQALSPTYYVKPGTCCIDLALPPPDVSAAQLAQQFPRGYTGERDASTCRGVRPTAEQDRAMLQGTTTYDKLLEAHAQEVADAEAAALRVVRAEQREGERRYIAAIPEMSGGALCAAVGEAVRSGANSPAGSALQREATKRRLSFSTAKMLKRNFSLGDSTCQMYGALGIPDSVNRTVTSGGERTQHVFRDDHTYVYTSNGRITAFQD